jgi:hypothetical protein
MYSKMASELLSPRVDEHAACSHEAMDQAPLQVKGLSAANLKDEAQGVGSRRANFLIANFALGLDM